ncbi:hypothetical protein [Motiliproteus sp. SC1-56]|uniref:hypothetical protein n=1 Tax=Motiliproteus sp. SC1-56 TaxID=2799565 RepID=UPI001A8ED5FE|nr:hypothetical protein [Motiliproteus sp. SC1-56]
MNWVFIVLILLAIVGSMMWMMPSPRQRAQALLRQKAMRLGIQVQISRLLFPRALGEAVADERDCTAYRLARTQDRRRGRQAPVPWQIFKVRSHANTGLPEGWSWGRGEGQLTSEQLALIAGLIEILPADVYALESTPVSAGVYWNEHGDLDTVDLVFENLEKMLEANL